MTARTAMGARRRGKDAALAVPHLDFFMLLAEMFGGANGREITGIVARHAKGKAAGLVENADIVISHGSLPKDETPKGISILCRAPVQRIFCKKMYRWKFHGDCGLLTGVDAGYQFTAIYLHSVNSSRP